MQKVDLIQGTANAFRAERGTHNQVIEELQLGIRPMESKYLPVNLHQQPFAAWIASCYLDVLGPMDQASLNRDVQIFIELLGDSDKMCFNEDAILALFRPHNRGLLRDNLFHLMGGFFFNGAELQTSVDQARIVCALERSWENRLRCQSPCAECRLRRCARLSAWSQSPMSIHKETVPRSVA